MPGTTWDAESPRVTRDRILRLLLKRQRTIEELAGKLGLTRNAVRSQIGLLQREGFVEIQGEIKGTRRPAAVYGLRPGMDSHFSKAYPVVLSNLITVLARKLPKSEYRTVMRELGQRLANLVPRPAGDPRERIKAAMNFLKLLGSTAEMTEGNGKVVITGYGCPIGEAVTADMRTCIAMEALLKHMTRLPVVQRCHHGERPSCRFEIKIPVGKQPDSQ